MVDKHIQEEQKSMSTIVIVTIACMLLFMLNNGVRSNFGLISTALHVRTGLPVDHISNAVAIAQLLYGLSQPFFGILALKRSNSFVLAIGGVLMGLGLAITPFATNLLMLYLALGISIGLAAGALAFGVVMGAASPTIGKKYAATVSGIVNGAGGLGGAILAPVLQISTELGLFAQSMIALAVIAGLVVLMCGWLGKQEKNALVDATIQEEASAISTLLKEALTSSVFMRLALSFLTCGFFMAIIETYLYPQLLSYEFEGSKVAAMFTLYGIMGMIGPIIAGILCNKIQPRFVLGTIYGLRPILVILFLLLPKTNLLVYAFIIGLGLTGNATVPVTTIIISDHFGTKKMPTLSGISMVFHQIGSFISTWLAGRLLNLTGTYNTIWMISGILALIAAILCYTIANKPKTIKGA